MVRAVPAVQNVPRTHMAQSSRDSGPPEVIRPDFRRRRNQRSPRIGLHDGAFRRAIHQADRALRINAAPVDFQPVLGSGRDHDGVEIDLAANDVTHTAFGAFDVVDF